MKKIVIVFLFMIVNSALFGQINKNGIPFVKNYAPSDYNAAEQNWSICEDKRGVIYVANNTNAILEYDGITWNKIPILNSLIVRSLEYSTDETVYVGGVEEFGYLSPDINGKMQYHSLSNQLDTIKFSDIWKIYTLNGDVYFCSQKGVMRYRNKKLVKVYDPTEMSFLNFKIHNKIYWGTVDKGLCELTEDSVAVSLGGEFYKDYDIFTMLPWSEKEILITTMGSGVYIYNTETGLSKKLDSLGEKYKDLVDFLNNSQAYNAIQLSSGNLAVATLDAGSIIFNNDGEIIYCFNKDHGLQDNTVISLYESKNGNLWLSLNKGVAFIELKTPFTKFDHNYGFEGLIQDVKRYQGTLFVTTNTKQYYLKYNEKNLPEFKEIPIDFGIIKMEVFKVPNSKKEKLLFATGSGVFEFVSLTQKPKQISEQAYYCEVLYQSKSDSNSLYIGYNTGVALLEYKNGKWIDKGKIGNFRYKAESIAEDDKGNIWMGAALKGVLKIKPDLTIERYSKENGIPEMGFNRTYFINNSVLTATSNGIYQYNETKNTFEKYKGFGEKYFESNDPVSRIECLNNNDYWIILKEDGKEYESVNNLKISQDRIVSIIEIPFKRLIKNTFSDLSSDCENGVWLASSEAIFNYKEDSQDDFSKYYNSLLRNVTIGIDSVVFGGTYFKDTSDLTVSKIQPKNLKITVRYNDRPFNFFYSTPYFPNEEIQYSYRLEGFDDNWSRWESKAEKEYTNLSGGKYTFMVKAKNIYGIESEEAYYEFAVKPPWYFSILAFIVYFILAILLIYVIVKIYTRRLELEKIRLEQIVKERTAEVVRQKEEIEAQRDEIAEKNQSITDSIEYASRIQKAILPSNEYADEILPEHFILFRPRDIVSGDFYWMTKKDELLVTIAADCTGHGVPGAFMSMLGVSFLNEIVNRHEIISAGEILTQLRTDVKRTLGQEGKEGEAKDGMDIALTIVDLKNMKMQYAGAYNPMYLYRNNELIEIKADRMPIGIYVKEKESFTNNEIELQKGDVYYIFSDGYQDQFGGEDGMKFKTKNFKQLLLEIHQKPMAEQREILNTTIDNWRGIWEQVDDIIVLGVRI